MRFAGIQLCQFNVFAESLKDAVDLLFKVGITCACFTLGHSMLISAGERGVESRTDRSTTREAELRGRSSNAQESLVGELLMTLC